MRILICSATSLEIAPTLQNYGSAQGSRFSLSHLVTGVGMLSCSHALTNRLCTESADLVILAGIGGCFNSDSEIGKSFLVNEDLVADLGVEEDGNWKDLFDMKLANPHEHPYQNGLLVNPGHWKKHLGTSLSLPMVRGCTVNEVSTNETRIAMLKKKYNPVLESMEGAAIHYVCIKEDIPFLHLRTISNFVGERNKNNWNIPLAVRNLNKDLQHILSLF